MITRSRGEVRHMSSPKITSSTSTPANAHKSLDSPLRSYHSPCVNERRGQSPLSAGGRGPYSPRTAEAKQYTLGKSPLNPSSK